MKINLSRKIAKRYESFMWVARIYRSSINNGDADFYWWWSAAYGEYYLR